MPDETGPGDPVIAPALHFANGSLRMTQSRALLAVVVLGSLITVGAYYPGVTSPDSIEQLGQARAWSYATTQPPVMTLLWGILDLVVRGPALMLVLQAACWWGGWALVLRRVLPDAGWRQPLALLVVGFWPPLFAMTGTIWRDVHMTLALLLAVGILLGADTGNRRGWLWVAGLLVAYASAVRLNAVFSVLPLAGWVAWRVLQPLQLSRRTAVMLGGAAVLTMALAGRVVNPLMSSSIWHTGHVVQLFDLVGVSARTGKNLVPSSVRNGNETPAQIASLYSAFSCFPALWRPRPGKPGFIEMQLLTVDDDARLAEIQSAWQDAIREHPGAYLKHRLAVFAANMGWNDLPLHYPYAVGAAANTLDVRWDPSSLSLRTYAALDGTLAHASWLWRPWLYLWCSLLLLAGAVVCMRRGAGGQRTVLILASGMLYTLPYLLAAPAADLRYHHWPIATVFLGGLCLLCDVGLPQRRTMLKLGAAIGAATLLLAYMAWNGRIVDFGPAAPVPARAEASTAQGLQYLARGEWEDARAHFAQAADRAPYWWVPRTNLALAKARLGDVAGARRDHERAVMLDVTHAGARRFHENFLAAQGQPDLQSPPDTQ